VVKNNTVQGAQYTSFSVVINNGKLTTPDGKVVEYTQNTTRTWIKGDDSPLNIFDDVYEISGTQSGVSSKDIYYTLTSQANNPLLVDVGCGNIIDGVLDVDIEGASDMSIDYYNDDDGNGDPDCDGKATLRIGLLEFSIGQE
jgi:hypothetical protein